MCCAVPAIAPHAAQQGNATHPSHSQAKCAQAVIASFGDGVNENAPTQCKEHSQSPRANAKDLIHSTVDTRHACGVKRKVHFPLERERDVLARCWRRRPLGTHKGSIEPTTGANNERTRRRVHRQAPNRTRLRLAPGRPRLCDQRRSLFLFAGPDTHTKHDVCHRCFGFVFRWSK